VVTVEAGAVAAATGEGWLRRRTRRTSCGCSTCPLYTRWLGSCTATGATSCSSLAPSPDGIEANRAYPADQLLGVLANKTNQIPHMEPGDARGG
jgi:hypothetical protein